VRSAPGRALLVVVAAGAITAVVGSAPATPAVTAGQGCNGSVRLCGVPLGDVAFATTHNSMASSADGFVPPNQDEPIAAQLRHGIRGFQIDVYAGFPREGRVYTELEGRFGSQATDLPKVFVDQAVRIHRQIGAPPAGTPTEVYLCHTFCELGAVRMDAVMRQVHAFLDAHPRAVLVMVVEDYVPPDRIREVLDRAGLGPMLLAVPAGTPLPTLGVMVDTGKRLLVSLENGDGGTTLPNAFAGLVEETPFTFVRSSDLRSSASCVDNRGLPGSPIFQLNHWVTPARRHGSSAVNRAVLRERVARCTEARGRGPTLVAVDFAEHGDLLGVVRELNRGTG
jgi:hypothetical protein